MDLYIDDKIHFTKIAAEVALPDDPNGWPQEVLQELYKQVPYIADFEPTVTMEAVDAERGYGVGHFEIENKSEAPQGLSPDQRQAIGLRHVRVPIIIKDKKLQPFDVLITDDSKAQPLTESRLRQSLFRPQAFDVTSRTPGDQSMVGQLYPPYRQNYGFGGGGMGVAAGGEKTGADTQFTEPDFEGKLQKVLGLSDQEVAKLRNVTKPESTVTLGAESGKKTAAVGSGNTKPVADAALQLKMKDVVPKQGGSAKTASVLDAILPTIYGSDLERFALTLQEPGVEAAYRNNPGATHRAISKLAAAEPIMPGNRFEKLASVAVVPQVMQLRRTQDGYAVKTASVHAWKPEQYATPHRGAMIQAFGEKVVLAADVSGSVTLSEGPAVGESPAEDGVSPAESKPKVISDFGLYKVRSAEGKELIGFVIPNLIDIDGTALPIALFTNGSQAALQAEIVGERAGEGTNLPTDMEPSGEGTFYRALPNGQVEALVPMKILGKVAEEGTKYSVETFAGDRAEVAPQNGIRKPVRSDNTLLVPADYRWLPMGEAEEVQLIDDPDAFTKTSAPHREWLRVTVRSGGPDSFSFDGIPLQKFAHSEKNFLSLDDAMFLLAGLGVNLEYGARKLAEAVGLEQPVDVRIGRQIKTAAEAVGEAHRRADAIISHIPNLRQNLVKEAAFVPDPTAVDTVLSLGFINPENILTFVSYLPQIEEVQSKLCELLIAARLGGLSDIPVGALEKSIKATESVVDGLKILAFTGQSDKTQ